MDEERSEKRRKIALIVVICLVAVAAVIGILRTLGYVSDDALRDVSFWLYLPFGLAFFYFFRIHIAVKMAERRNRSRLGWGLFSCFISPILAWILLAVLGTYVPPRDY